ncbi:tRNA glutamyl-Q(34) synthetase GluQRS [Celerinatantimonas diazotrophica]|uniref:Glutamyl-Q tRNA(Asp) synthetase n=1 Tax=Celerinatantimonas diazotrophica TaxID=412034 RepID=A0A4V2PNG1_9GAMM|nr:tRNA glutamyl-Q(34) synthetase GluQRS [Celerinatantimonas diazotrophica]TCK46911.1 glutamyl-Q tRNA(Asp) synthetase [Celerinatantimonas diazotrophica]CAG9295679.1 Glutamyl-Q tRNA(Asp) synthetase [Celerinatantimonas diazotrophica]
MTNSAYIGRFAPSPSGPLHFGSLVTAVGSFLQARHYHGRWLVRIEDIDPPREVSGASDVILQQLNDFGLHWDDQVIYQSQHLNRYQRQIDTWLATGDAYYCQCTRKQIQVRNGGIYDGHCRFLALENKPGRAIRLHCNEPTYGFMDQLRGWQPLKKNLAHEDLIIFRRDGLYAYNLAVVLDDIDAHVSEIVRGSDLLEPTARQCNLYRMLKRREPDYLHLPLACDSTGRKLSKQNHAPALSQTHILKQLHDALAFLGHQVPNSWQQLPPPILLAKMAQVWDKRNIPPHLSN